MIERVDDTLEVVRKRLEVYERETRPLVEFYGVRPTFRTVDGAQPPDRVAADIEEAVKAAAAAPRDFGAAARR